MQKTTYHVEIEIDETSGEVISETWRNGDGQLDRPNGPAVVSKLENQQMEYRAWYQRGKLSRTDGGPASIHLDLSSGKPLQQIWASNDEKHREGGEPAVIKYRRNSDEPEAVEYWRNGRQYTPKP